MKTYDAKPLRVLLVNGFSLPRDELDAIFDRNSDKHLPVFSLPQNILTLAAVAMDRLKGLEVGILDANKEMHFYFRRHERTCRRLDEFMDAMLDAAPLASDVVGISVNYSTGHSSSLLLADRIKARWPGTKVILGGVHVTNYALGVITHPSVDFLVRGPGEIAFVQFLEHLREGKNPADIPGVVDSPLSLDTTGEPMADINDIPRLPYELLDMETYLKHDSRCLLRETDTRSVSYQFSRGCCFNCTFCAGSTVHGRKVQLKRNDKVIEELRYLVETYGVNTVIVEDDLFGYDKKRFNELCDQLEQSSFRLKMKFPNALSVAVLNEPMIDRLLDIGLESAVLAIESGSFHVQKNVIRKNCNLSKALRLAEYIRGKGVPVMAYFILGFPGESVAMMRETIEFAKSMHLDWAYFFMACPFHGTEMHRQLTESGVLDEDKMAEIMNNTDFTRRLFDTPEISARDLETLGYDANIEVNFLNNYNMLHGLYERAAARFSLIIDHYPFHIVALACRAKCLQALGQAEAACRDLETMANMVRNHAEAQRLYERYGSAIEKLDLPECGHGRAVAAIR